MKDHFRSSRIALFLTLSLVLGGVIAFAEEEPSISFMEYHNEEFNVRIDYPEDWEMQEKFMGTVAIFLSPQESSTDQFRENLNVITQDLSEQPTTLDEYAQTSLAQIKQLMTDFK